MNLENKPQKKTKTSTKLPFLTIWTSRMGHLGGGRASHFFHIFSSLGPLWASLGSKWCQGPHHETIFLPCWVRFNSKILKNVPSSGKQSQTSIEVFFENWRAFRPVFRYMWVDFVCRVQPTREWKLRGV